MGWEEDTKVLIESLLEDMETPKFADGYLADIESSLKTSLELGVETIEKIQGLDITDEDHETRLQTLETEGCAIPVKIWEGNYDSGNLVPSTDAGHVSETGVLADYKTLVFLCHEVNGDTEEHNCYWMPQALWSFFDSSSKMYRLQVDSQRIKVYFADEETITVGSGGDVEILQIWGIK